MGERYTLKQIQKLQLYFEYIYWHLFKVLRLQDKVVTCNTFLRVITGNRLFLVTTGYTLTTQYLILMKKLEFFQFLPHQVGGSKSENCYKKNWSFY